MGDLYDHERPSAHSHEDCEEAVGKRAGLNLTGSIVEARMGPAGPYVMFKPDERWGFGGATLGLDLDALDVVAS